MNQSLAPGLERNETLTVDRARTIDFLGEQMRVYSTPSMVNDFEYVCFRLLGEHLDAGESSVGVHVSMDHLGATPLGATVSVRVRLQRVEGRKVTFTGEIADAAETVGRGTHTRFVVDTARHAERLAAKRTRL